MDGVRDLVFDWNRAPGDAPQRRVCLDDETLRDGLQSPSVKAPPLAHQKEFLHLLAGLGVEAVDIGLPAAGPVQAAGALELAREAVRARLPLALNCAARTLASDVRPVVEISQKAGVSIEVATFIGASPVRLLAEDWDREFLLRSIRTSVSEVVRAGLPCMFVTEDTTRTPPETLRTLVLAAVEAGARGVCIADTVGFATPRGASRVAAFLREVLDGTGEKIRLDYHGHRDRGLGLSTALAAWESGADRLHGAFLGLGERVGNTPLDLLLVNLKMLGAFEGDLTGLGEAVEKVARWLGVEIPFSYPVFGRDAYRTGTGVHASAMIKGRKRGSEDLSELVYAAAPARWFGLKTHIEVGPMSGESNVVHWLESHGIEAAPSLVHAIHRRAKHSSRTLSDEDLWALVGDEESRGRT